MFNVVKDWALSIADASSERKWGKSITLDEAREGSNLNGVCRSYREKFLVLKPKASIVLESHGGYSEVWMADNGFNYALEIGEKIELKTAKKFERVFIPVGKKHKIINPHELDLCIFEIQIGEIKANDKVQYLKEDEKLRV